MNIRNSERIISVRKISEYFKNRDKIYLIMLAGFVLRLLFILLDNNFDFLPYDWDTTEYHLIAMQIKENILAGNNIFSNVSTSISYRSYSFFSAILYLIFGSHEIVIRIFNAFLGILIAKKVYDIVLLTKLNDKIATYVAFLVTFWPSFFLFTSINMRESLIIFITCDLIIRYIKLYSKKEYHFIILAVDFILLALLRKQNLPLYLFIIILHFLFEQFRKKSKRFKLTAGLIIVILIFCGIIIIDSNLDLLSFKYFAAQMEARTRGGSAYLEWMEYDSIIDIFKYLPLRFLYFTFGPFIWDIENLFMFFVFLQSSVLIVLSLLTAKYFYDSGFKANREMIFLLMFMLIGLAANSLIDANYGTSFRHRMPYIIPLFIFSSVYLKRFFDIFLSWIASFKV